MNGILCLIYDVCVYFPVTFKKIHPFIIMSISFLVLTFNFTYKLEFCASLGVIFFGSILRKYNNHTFSANSLVTLALILILTYSNIYVGFILQNIYDYKYYNARLYLEKNTNKVLTLIVTSIWSGNNKETVALILLITMAHGAFISYKIKNKK